jgi:uncharacterized protein (UPF0261 family)
MTADKTILVIGTYDTKNDELTYICDRIRGQGGATLSMDVSVLGDPDLPTEISKHDVAAAAGCNIQAVIDSGDENTAMQFMARGAATLAAGLLRDGRIDGALILGGSMGTDLALDVCNALPLGVPKYIVSTVAFSPLIPTERLAADIQMILWAGGLYGLSSVCKSALSQAAGAVLGAARAVEAPRADRPLIGVTSLGTSALKYITTLKPALEARGYDVAVFHATGMGGRAFESMAGRGGFACVFDLCTQELGNHVHGSSVTSGADRLTNAGIFGTPQLVAPGCYDLVDIAGWADLPEKWQDHPRHAHNRLITSIVLNEAEVRIGARAHCAQLAKATGPTALLLPQGGCGEWDRPGADLHNPAGLSAFLSELAAMCPDNVTLHRLDAHINDPGFVTAALAIFDEWVAQGLVKAA